MRAPLCSRVSVSVCVRACVRACVYMCTCVCMSETDTQRNTQTNRALLSSSVGSLSRTSLALTSLTHIHTTRQHLHDSVDRVFAHGRPWGANASDHMKDRDWPADTQTDREEERAQDEDASACKGSGDRCGGNGGCRQGAACSRRKCGGNEEADGGTTAGLFVAVLRNYKVVADGVLCQGDKRRITTWAIKHKTHDVVPHGCLAHPNTPEIFLPRALLAFGWNGWFFGHFVQDVLSKTAFAVHVLDKQAKKQIGGGDMLQSVAVIVEGDSQVRGLICPP